MPGALTPRQCDRVIELGESLRVEAAELANYDPGNPIDEATRRSKVAWIEPTAESAWLYDKLAKLAQRANRSYQFELIGFGEDLQYTVYDEPGAFYTWHQDGLTGDVATRKLAIVVQLTDPAEYEGANLELFDLVADLGPDELAAVHQQMRLRGTAVAFPAFEYHRVTPLLSGVRRSLVVWISGPPFR